MIAVVTDSAAALPPALLERWGITVVPMWLSVGGEPVREGERNLGELLGDAGVTTSAPTPGEFEAAIRRRLDDGASGVIVLTIASAMSGAHQAATLAARPYGDRVRVIDTMTAAGAQALVVLAAARAAADGADVGAVVAVAADVVGRVRLVATVPSVEHLVRSGRVPGIAGWAGRTLGISPLFEFSDGRVHRLRPALGFDAALDRIVTRFRRSSEPRAKAHVVALHALSPEAAQGLLARVDGVFDSDGGFVSEFGSVMVVHTGPGLVGLAWWWEPAGAESGQPTG